MVYSLTYVNELHRTKPAPNVYYADAMPDVEALMQVWPDDVEELLQGGLKLPSGNMEMSTQEYAKKRRGAEKKRPLWVCVCVCVCVCVLWVLGTCALVCTVVCTV